MQGASRQLILIRLIRDPEIGRSECKLKIRGQDSDDRVALAVDGERAAKDARVAAKLSLPQSIRQHRGSRGAGNVFTGLKGPADDWLDAEHLEEVSAHAWSRHALGVTHSAEEHA